MSRSRLVFVISTLLLLALFGVATWNDANQEWKQYQRQYAKTLHGEERALAPRGVQQTVLPGLDAIDRCTTCHVAMLRPQLALGEQPFTAHPGDYLTSHPVEKFGCTSCHDGQGLATTAQAAHGDVKHWEEPLLRGPMVQASCGRCHGDVSAIDAPLLRQGMLLVQQNGCLGCHTIKDFGGTISQDLTDIGRKPYLQIDFTFVHGGHDRAAWIYEKLKNPQHIEPGHPTAEPPIAPSAMPRFGFTDAEALALTAYMLSLTGDDLPMSYVVPAPHEPARAYMSSVEHGAAVFQRFGCVGCHGVRGRGGRRNWNAYTSEEVPALTYVRNGYTKEALIEFIGRGSATIPKLHPPGPVPSLYMPAWAEKISEEEMGALADFLLSLAPESTMVIEAPSLEVAP